MPSAIKPVRRRSLGGAATAAEDPSPKRVAGVSETAEGISLAAALARTVLGGMKGSCVSQTVGRKASKATVIRWPRELAPNCSTSWSITA